MTNATTCATAPVELTTLMTLARMDGIDLRVGKFCGQPLDVSGYPDGAVLLDVQEDGSGKLWAHGLSGT